MIWSNFEIGNCWWGDASPMSPPRSTTVNLFEAWHRGFLSTRGCHRSTVWKFIHCLKTEQGNVELKQLKFTHRILIH